MSPCGSYEFPDTSDVSLSDICAKTQEVFGKTPCLWQCQLGQALFQWQDVFSIAATGDEKTLTFCIPLLFCGEGILLIITALNALGDLQFVNDATEAGYPAISVTTENNNKKTFVHM